MSLFQRITKGPWLPPYQSNSAYAWLVMLLFFFWKYLARGISPLELTWAIISVAIFLVLYFVNFWAKGLLGMVPVLAICLIGLIWAPFNAGASVFVIFSAACCASVQPNKYAYACLVLVLASVTIESMVLNLPGEFWVPAFLVSSSIGVATIMQSSLRHSRDKLIRSQEEVMHLATIAERERISRDLHDLLGHTLSLITIKAELAGKLIGRDAEACKQEIADIEKTARNALSEVRAAVSGYRQVGFTHELANAASCLAALNIDLTTHIDTMQLSANAENVLTLALREAITNVARHSGAGQCEIRLSAQGNWVVLEVNDNGKKLIGKSDVALGNGLTGMRERATAIGGQILLNTAQGLSLQIRLPKEHGTLQGVQA